MVAVSVGSWQVAGLPTTYPAVALLIWAGVLAILLATIPPHLPGAGLGPANRITLGRAVLVIPLSALAAFPGSVGGPGVLWGVIGVATTVLILDGVDGWVARRTGTATSFGARFDMELDAYLMAALTLLVWASGKVGAWVLLIGALRYLFVAAGRVWPALQEELPESRRRKTVCVVQGVVLLVALGPIIPAPVAQVVCGLGLGLLVYSFAVDVWWLSRPVSPRPLRW